MNIYSTNNSRRRFLQRVGSGFRFLSLFVVRFLFSRVVCFDAPPPSWRLWSSCRRLFVGEKTDRSFLSRPAEGRQKADRLDRHWHNTIILREAFPRELFRGGDN